MELQKSEQTKKCCSVPRSGTSETNFAFDMAQTAPPTEEISMVQLPGGQFLMGTDYVGGFAADGEGPVRPVLLSPFAIDTTPVTNKSFAEFVRNTGYKTDAERFGWSFVFWNLIPEDVFEQLVTDTVAEAPWWCQVPGANWMNPEGQGSSIEQRLDHPVVHASFADAEQYARWANKQLPTEAEWEYAARGGLIQKLYPWGDELQPGGEHLCNVWQGEFPTRNTTEDGWLGTCPVRSFPPNKFGLYSVAGNVWEWTADWFGVSHPRHETTNPRGPRTGSGRVMKGGSFLCHESYCNRYRVAARTQNTPDSSTSNLGFRCVRRA